MGEILGAYAAWHKDAEVLKNCTSGGAATALSEKTLEDGGVVIGAMYDEQMNVIHKAIEDKAGLSKIAGVKYVSGKINRDLFLTMRRYLDQGRKVMFVGLPCQVAAVKNMFGENSKLLLCDLVCFGAPPHSLWRKYVDWMSRRYGKKLVNVNPRDKRSGWGRKTYYRYDWADGTSMRRLSTYDPYSKAFYSAIGFKQSCFCCKFRGQNRSSDVTLCDFWGAEKIGLPDSVVKNGVSGILVHTEKGFLAVESANLECRKVEYSELISENRPIEVSPQMPQNWGQFSMDLERMDFGDLIVKYQLQVTKLQVMGRRFKAFVSAFLKRCGYRNLKRV